MPRASRSYLRVDAVHQGDQNGAKGVFHIPNAIDRSDPVADCSATERISEAWLVPVLRTMLEQFPFRILGFHSDNGKRVSLMPRWLSYWASCSWSQTKSRPRQSNDNALVETKNGAVIRKHIGYSRIRSPVCRAHPALL